MRRILYILALASLSACNSGKTEQAKQNYAATPNGLADLQKNNPAIATSTATASNKSNLLLNPAHGEPGHDCSIAVGAPLKASARTNVATPTPKPTIQTVTPPPTATVNTVPQPVATIDSKGQKLNPAHGQPNHRCDIAVGAPLNSKPVQAAANVSKPNITVSQPTATTPNQAPVLNEKGQRLNPAHGQPGHKCEVAVGAPLT